MNWFLKALLNTGSKPGNGEMTPVIRGNGYEYTHEGAYRLDADGNRVGKPLTSDEVRADRASKKWLSLYTRLVNLTEGTGITFSGDGKYGIVYLQNTATGEKRGLYPSTDRVTGLKLPPSTYLVVRAIAELRGE